MDKEESVRVCYEWQINNLEFGSQAKKLSKQFCKIGLGYIWQDLRENSVRGICKKQLKMQRYRTTESICKHQREEVSNIF
jgi:hypothetical protein